MTKSDTKEIASSPQNSKPKKIGINPFAPKSTLPDPGADYDPSKKKYHPIDDAFWKKGEK